MLSLLQSCSTTTLLACSQADREKADAAAAAERARAEETAAAQRAAAQAAAEQARQEAEAADAAARFQAGLDAKRARLMPEPPAGAAGAVDVMVRLPGGGRASRRCDPNLKYLITPNSESGVWDGLGVGLVHMMVRLPGGGRASRRRARTQGLGFRMAWS